MEMMPGVILKGQSQKCSSFSQGETRVSACEGLCCGTSILMLPALLGTSGLGVCHRGLAAGYLQPLPVSEHKWPEGGFDESASTSVLEGDKSMCTVLRSRVHSAGFCHH